MSVLCAIYLQHEMGYNKGTQQTNQQLNSRRCSRIVYNLEELKQWVTPENCHQGPEEGHYTCKNKGFTKWVLALMTEHRIKRVWFPTAGWGGNTKRRAWQRGTKHGLFWLVTYVLATKGFLPSQLHLCFASLGSICYTFPLYTNKFWVHVWFFFAEKKKCLFCKVILSSIQSISFHRSY